MTRLFLGVLLLTLAAAGMTIVALRLGDEWKITALQNTNMREQPPE